MEGAGMQIEDQSVSDMAVENITESEVKENVVSVQGPTDETPTGAQGESVQSIGVAEADGKALKEDAGNDGDVEDGGDEENEVSHGQLNSFIRCTY
jgi:hypothetical protein